MKTEVEDIWNTLASMLKKQVPPLKIRKDTTEVLEVCGTKETMQGKQKVDGFYFASVLPKAKDCRFYFFPIYTHVNEFATLSNEAQKALKGKSCFHIKKLSPELEKEIEDMIKKGVKLYKKDGLI
jgi:hypothetical protein